MKLHALSILVLGVAIGGCTPTSPTPSASGAPPSADSSTATVKRQNLVGYDFFDGRLDIPADAQAVAYSPYDTPVVSVLTAVGKHVGRGEPIVKLQIPGADEAKTEAQAGASAAGANYSEARSAASGPLKSAEQAVRDARAAEKAAKDTVAAGGTADVDSATQARVQAEANLQTAQDQLKQSLLPAKEAAADSQAQLAAAKADAAQGLIRSPISGTVVSLNATAGTEAKSKQNVATIIDYDRVHAIGTVPAAMKDEVVRGARVIVALDGATATPVDGRVSEVRVAPPAAGQSSSGYLAVISFRDPASIVPPVSGVKRIGVRTGEVHDVLVVPVAAVYSRDGASYVDVQKEGAWVPTPVTTGVSDGALIEIKTGLTEGQTIRAAH